MIQIVSQFVKSSSTTTAPSQACFLLPECIYKYAESYYFVTQLFLEIDAVCSFLFLSRNYFNWCQMSNYLLNTILIICIFQLTQNMSAWCICNEFPTHSKSIDFNELFSLPIVSISKFGSFVVIACYISFSNFILTVTRVTEYLSAWEIKALEHAWGLVEKVAN